MSSSESRSSGVWPACLRVRECVVDVNIKVRAFMGNIGAIIVAIFDVLFGWLLRNRNCQRAAPRSALSGESNLPVFISPVSRHRPRRVALSFYYLLFITSLWIDVIFESLRNRSSRRATQRSGTGDRNSRTATEIEAGRNVDTETARRKSPSTKLAETILGISGQSLLSIAGSFALSSSPYSLEWKIFGLLLGFGYICTLTSLLIGRRDSSSTRLPITDSHRTLGTIPRASQVDEVSSPNLLRGILAKVSNCNVQEVLGKLGAQCVSTAVIGSMAMVLSLGRMWTWIVTVALSLIPLTAVLKYY